MLRLRPLYEQLSAAQSAWATAHAAATRELTSGNDEAGLALLRREFPAIGHESAGGPAIVDDADAEFYRQAELGAVAQAARSWYTACACRPTWRRRGASWPG